MALIKLNLTLTDPSNAVPMVTDWDALIPAIAGLLAWCPARASTVSLDGSNGVITLVDQSGNGNDFTQSTEAARPLWQASQVNGQGAMRFTAATPNSMVWGGTFPTGSNFTKVVLIRPSAAGSGTRHILGQTSSEKHALFLNSSNAASNSVGSTSSADAQTAALTDDTWNLVVASFDDSGNTAKIALNGGAVVTDTDAGALTNQSSLYLGVGSASNNAPFDGDIALLMVFNSDLLAAANAADLATLEGYISDVYGVAL